MPTAYVTGANGFLGTHLVERLLGDGLDVVALVRPTSDVRNLSKIAAETRGRLRIVHGDVRDPASLGPGLEQADVIYHLAAVLMGTSEEEFHDANVGGTRTMLERAEKLPNLQRFLFVSSQAAAGPAPTAEPIDETRPAQPVSWYGRSKADAEKVVREFGERGLPVTIVRPGAVYGEREVDVSGASFPMVRAGIAPKIGFGRRNAAFVYVADLIEGVVAAAASSDTLGKTYFLADPEPYATTRVTRAAADAMGKRLRIPITIPHVLLYPVAIALEWGRLLMRGRPALTRDKWRELGQRFWSCTPAAAKRDFGWESRRTLREGMGYAVADWNARRVERLAMAGESHGDLLKKTFAIALGFGLVVEGLSQLGGFYRFTPWWVLLIVVFGVFCGVMGTVSWITRRAGALVQFLAGAAIGIGAEFLNEHVLHAWVFTAKTTDLLPDPTVRSILLGLPAGLMPVLVNVILRRLWDRRRRIG